MKLFGKGVIPKRDVAGFGFLETGVLRVGFRAVFMGVGEGAGAEAGAGAGAVLIFLPLAIFKNFCIFAKFILVGRNARNSALDRPVALFCKYSLSFVLFKFVSFKNLANSLYFADTLLFIFGTRGTVPVSNSRFFAFIRIILLLNVFSTFCLFEPTAPKFDIILFNSLVFLSFKKFLSFCRLTEVKVY